LFDELEREQLSLAGLADIVPDEFAAHWQVTVEFLKILSEQWPLIVKEEGLISPQAYRNDMLTVLAAHWQSAPPVHPVIAAGTTGSIPATAELLKVIAGLPQGAVVLPGLDTQADEDYFEYLSESHPQWGMKQLLVKLGCVREDVKEINCQWPVASGQYRQPATGNRQRATLLSEIMRPAETSHVWQNLTLDVTSALNGLCQVECESAQEEAAIIALMLREVLETLGKSAALVTHDRKLARRVSAIMQRFGVTMDDSAGIPLMQTPTASFLRLILQVAESNIAPVPLLSLLKHPLTHAGMTRAECLEAARELEISVFRKPFSKKRDVLPKAQTLLNNIKQIFAPLIELLTSKQTLAALLDAHLQCAQLLSDDTLWNGDEADALLDFTSQLQAIGEEEILIEASVYPEIFETLLAGKVFRPDYGMHPRLKILSPLEARMQSFDRIILGGLNEGSWPPQTIADPWFSRPMRSAIGLPSPERRIGLAAHDFATLACAPEVFFTRAQKIDGVPTTPARWLVTLETLLSKFAAAHRIKDERWNLWARALDASKEVVPTLPPAPTPPLSARPRSLSVTQVETWMRDPYSLYARQILKLKPLDPLAEGPMPVDFGNAVHQALEDFVRTYPAALPADAYEKLLECGRKAFATLLSNANVEALWWPRFERIAAWVIEQEQFRRPLAVRVLTEVEGAMEFGNFTLKGRADRIEEGKDASLTIVDYKTGTLPTGSEIEGGIASQLVLLAIIMGGNAASLKLEYWQVQGGRRGGKIQPVDEAKIDAYIEESKEGLHELIEIYSDPDFPYYATPISSRARRYNDYEHLARVKEWS
jgi:ATP-dependent helicase/nuclease subunit B